MEILGVWGIKYLAIEFEGMEENPAANKKICYLNRSQWFLYRENKRNAKTARKTNQYSF
jgi:hypothetical protein